MQRRICCALAGHGFPAPLFGSLLQGRQGRRSPSAAPTAPLPCAQNVVATVNLECKLDLKNIALHARNAEYNPKRFAAVIMRIREPKSTALIFHSGKMVCTGTKSEQEARIASRKYAKILQKLSYAVSFKVGAGRGWQAGGWVQGRAGHAVVALAVP